MHHGIVIALTLVQCFLLHYSYGLSAKDDLLAKHCPDSAVIPHSTRRYTTWITWAEPYATKRAGILRNIKSHPPGIKPPIEVPIGNTTIKYTLKLKNGKETSCSFTVTVFEKVKLIRRLPKKICLQKGAELRLKCLGRLRSSPVSYKWLFNGSPLKSNHNVKMNSDGHVLTLNNLARSHAGKYTCVAYNTVKWKANKASTSTHVRVGACRVHWTQWSEWGKCQPIMDNIGLKYRTRSCVTLEGRRHATGCEGKGKDGQTCIDRGNSESSRSTTTPVSPTSIPTEKISIFGLGLSKAQKEELKKIMSEKATIRTTAKTVLTNHHKGSDVKVTTRPITKNVFTTHHRDSNLKATTRPTTKNVFTTHHKGSNLKVTTRPTTKNVFTTHHKGSNLKATTRPTMKNVFTTHHKGSNLKVTTRPTTKNVSTTHHRGSNLKFTTRPWEVVKEILSTHRGVGNLKVATKPPAKNVLGDSEDNNSKGFLSTFYGKLALGSSLTILALVSCCAGFVIIGNHIEKKEKIKERRFMKDLEKPDSTDGPSKDEIYDYDEEIDRKAFEKRRVIKELTPKDRKRSELDKDLQIARAVILEEGIDKEHEREVADKRKQVVKKTSSAACKVSLLESINCTRAIIMPDRDAAEDDSRIPTETVNIYDPFVLHDEGETSSVVFGPEPKRTLAGDKFETRSKHKNGIPSRESSRGSSYHSMDETKHTEDPKDRESFSMMMVQPVVLGDVAKQAEVKYTDDWGQKNT